MIRRIGYIAAREFLGTVMTRGFLIGVLILPALLALAFTLGPRLLNQRSAPVRGQIAVVDPTGRVAGELREAATPQAIGARRAEAARRVMAAAPAAVREAAESGAAASNAAVERISGAVPELQLVERAPDANDPADLRSHKAWLTDTTPGERHLALIVVQRDAVDPAPGGGEYGTYQLYVPPNLDDRIENVLFDCLRAAIVSARAKAQRLDPRSVDALVRVNRAASITVSKVGERATVGVFNRVLPFAFVGLLLFSVMMGGQGLVTSTVEEKTSRVIEVLLSAVSPFELLAGKILGQMAVSLVVLGLYIGLAFMVLASFALFGLLDLSLVLYLLLFFVITYLTIGSAMAAVGVGGQRDARGAVADDADHPGHDGAVDAGRADRAPAELDVQHGDQLHPAGEHVRDAAADDVERSPAGLAGLGDDRHRPGGGRRLGVVRGQGLHDRPADVRQAAGPENTPALDPGILNV